MQVQSREVEAMLVSLAVPWRTTPMHIPLILQSIFNI
jgi:hypothetical protein